MDRPHFLSSSNFKAYDLLSSPVWLFSAVTYQILASNRAAQEWLRCDAQTLHSMSVSDMHPAQDQARLVECARQFNKTANDIGRWTIISQPDVRHDVTLIWSKVDFEGTEAIVASLRDIEETAPSQPKPEEPSAGTWGRGPDTGVSRADLLHIMNGLPGKMVVLTPKTHVILAVTDQYANAVRRPRETLLGARMFEVLGDEQIAPRTSYAHDLGASLARVAALCVPDVMGLKPFMFPADDGGFEERFYLPQTRPILNPDGQVAFIVHCLEDVTELVTENRVSADSLIQIDAGLVMQLAEARAALFALKERDKRLQMASSLMGIASWEHDFQSDAVCWSDRAFEIYGLSPDAPPPDFETYFDLTHPDDRPDVLLNFTKFMQTNAPELKFQHRIIKADGSIAHIRGVGARLAIDGREIVIGFVQDISDLKAVEEQLRLREQRKRLADRLARLGNWRVGIGDNRVMWCDETAAIHDEPDGTSPSLEDAIAYYVPEHRHRIRERLNACIQDGSAIDETLQIVTAHGRRVWVRTLGEPVRDDSGRIVSIDGAFQDISEIIAAQDAATALSARLHQTLESMSEGFMLLSFDFKYLYFNSRAEAFVGRSRDDLIGRSMFEVFPETRGDTFHIQYERAIKEGRAVQFEEYSPILKAWLEIRAFPTPEGLAVYGRDISQRREHDEKLRLLESAVSRQNDILLITDAATLSEPDGPKIVYVNEAFVRQTGYSRDETIGQTPRILQGPKTQRAELDRIRSALERREPVRAELINYKKSGEELWLELDIVPLFDMAGALTHFVAVERDITERKRAQQALHASEARLRLVTKATGSAIWEWDIVSDTLWWSDGMQEIFGHATVRGDGSPTSWRDLIHPDDRERAAVGLEKLRSGQKDILQELFRFRRADGSWAMVEDRGFSVRDEEGRVIRVLGSLTDNTERVQLEDHLRQAQKMEAVGQLTGGIAHDFNNLLTIMLGNAEILAEELNSHPELRRMAEMTVNAAERGAELTNRLLAFSRKQPLEPKVLDIGKLVQGIDGLLRRALPESIDLEIVRSGGLWKTELDTGQLETALLNLALNARDAMPDGGCLTIEMANASLDDEYVMHELDVRAGQYVMMTVTDTGHGIPQDALSRVFEPFFTTKSTGKGSGLGLSMVYGFVKQSGGHIRVYSEHGEGTSFKLYFPRSEAKEEHPVVAVSGRKVTGGRETILVVEDEEQVRAHVVSHLGSLGYAVLSAATGTEALDMLKNGPNVDLLFTDVVMPGGMGGRDLAEAARAFNPAIKVLFTSGYTENSIVHNGKLDRGVDLLSKPYRREQLAAKVRKVLDNS